MLDFLKLFLVGFVIFFLIDILWLGIVARKLYKKYLGYIMAEKVKWVPALIFYVIFIAGLVFFAMLGTPTWYEALYRGALFGFIAYATYDLTNLSTLKGWPLPVTIIDLLWGTFLGGAVSTLTFLVVNALF